MHHTIRQLQALDRARPTERKLLLVPTINFGRELLASLAQLQGGWIGWEVATLATVAARLSSMELARRGRRRGSDVAIANAISVAFERAVAANGVSPALATLAWSAGTHRAISDAVLEARIAGVTQSMLRSAGSVGLASSLAAVFSHVEAVLAERSLADAALVFEAAVADFGSQARFVLNHAVLVATPGWTVRGTPAKLFSLLAQHGLQVLKPLTAESGDTPIETSDGCIANNHPVGLVDELATILTIADAANVQVVRDEIAVTPIKRMFCAGTAQDEIRSVFRQTLAAGHNLDEIEIACVDRDNYGVIIDALCKHLGACCTLLDGLPLNATRVGRALERWLLWVESGYQSSILREAIESGDFTHGNGYSPNALSRELRNLRIGWGLEATHRAIARLASPAWIERIRPFEDEGIEVFEARRAARISVALELKALLAGLVSATPDLEAANVISVAKVAQQTIGVMKFVEARSPAEASTMQRLLERLQEIAAVDASPMPCLTAIASLRHELMDLRAWTESSDTTKPRRATGGHIHVTNLENAGATGRPLQFIVGLDADRTAGPVLQSPLLPDALRTRLNESGADLPTSEQRRREREWQLQHVIAGSYTNLTLSYAIRGGVDGREAAPGPVLLDAARKWSGNAELSYRDLQFLLGVPRSPIPETPAGGTLARPDSVLAQSDEAPVDARDVWLGAIGEGSLLLDATDQLRDAFPALGRGLNAHVERGNTVAGTFHGLVPEAGELDPFTTGHSISPSSLERIAACGLNWFYSVALDARIPDEPVYDSSVWLNPLDRGTALHRIYEEIIRRKLHETEPGSGRDTTVDRIVQEVAREMDRTVPAPAETIRARELTMLLGDAHLFVTSEHTAFLKEPWETVALESQFGGDDSAALLPLPNGQKLRLHGRVDRVDRLGDGTLRLIDYKTGRAFELDNRKGSFEGGRKLQLALYSPAISAQLGSDVSVAEYRFTTAKGDGAVARADAALLNVAPAVVQSLLDDLAAGRFLPTADPSDCRYCDYASVCRVTVGRFDHDSPRAEWAKQNAESNVHYDGMRMRRRAESES